MHEVYSDLARFASIFRADVARQVEFSFSRLAAVYGTGIPGDGREFWERVRRFANPVAFASEWVNAVDRLLPRLQPAGFFFKVDWGGERALRLTLYFRFEAAVPEPALAAALADAVPLAWDGPSPHLLGRCISEPAPFIIGFRTGVDGHQVAMYYRVRVSREEMLANRLPLLANELSLPDSVPGMVRETLAGLIGFGRPSILGVDSPRDDAPAELKLDVPGVLVADACAWISRHGADSKRVNTLVAVARRMRIELLSYCGAKVGAGGMVGWKLYMPVRPTGRETAAPRIRLGDDQHRIAGIPW